jgi:hypothetical protein
VTDAPPTIPPRPAIPQAPTIAPPALRAPPGPVASAALVRGAGIEALLDAIAAELGLGRDLVLERALVHYRKLCRRARRAGAAPEAFFRGLVEWHEQRALRTEIDELKARVAELRDAVAAAPAAAAAPLAAPRMRLAAGAERGGAASPVELFRQVRAARAARSAAGRPARACGGPTASDPLAAAPAPAQAGVEDAASRFAEEPGREGAAKATILTMPKPPSAPDAHRALSSVTAAANDEAPASRAAPAIQVAPASPEPSREARLDYVERRARVPKITF